MPISYNLRVGKPDVAPDISAHTPGVQQGNAVGSYEKQEGHLRNGRATSRRSTGIAPETKIPILPSMPNLSPA